MKEVISSSQNLPNTVVIITELQKIVSEYANQLSLHSRSAISKVFNIQKQKVDDVERILYFLDKNFLDCYQKHS